MFKQKLRTRVSNINSKSKKGKKISAIFLGGGGCKEQVSVEKTSGDMWSIIVE